MKLVYSVRHVHIYVMYIHITYMYIYDENIKKKTIENIMILCGYLLKSKEWVLEDSKFESWLQKYYAVYPWRLLNFSDSLCFSGKVSIIASISLSTSSKWGKQYTLVCSITLKKCLFHFNFSPLHLPYINTVCLKMILVYYFKNLWAINPNDSLILWYMMRDMEVESEGGERRVDLLSKVVYWLLALCVI